MIPKHLLHDLETVSWEELEAAGELFDALVAQAAGDASTSVPGTEQHKQETL